MWWTGGRGSRPGLCFSVPATTGLLSLSALISLPALLSFLSLSALLSLLSLSALLSLLSSLLSRTALSPSPEGRCLAARPCRKDGHVSQQLIGKSSG